MAVNRDTKFKRFIIHAILIIMVILSVYPALRVFGTSLRPTDRLHTTSLGIIPDGATFDAYVDLITRRDYVFLRWLLNSLVVSFFTVMVGVTLASTAGYVFSRKNFPGKRAGLTFFLITQMFPATMLLLPMYLLLARLDLINNNIGLIIMYSTTALPLCVWQMKGYYDTISESLEEAALVDGLNQFQAFYRIVLPLAAPALVITGLFSFMTAWSEFMVARVVMTNERMYTLPVGLFQMAGEFNTQWAMFSAASVLIMIPAMLIFLSVSKYLVGGLTLGGVKG